MGKSEFLELHEWRLHSLKATVVVSCCLRSCTFHVWKWRWQIGDTGDDHRKMIKDFCPHLEQMDSLVLERFCVEDLLLWSMSWPSFSPVMSMPNYFLWKSCLFDIWHNTTHNLKNHICEGIAAVPEEMLHAVMVDFIRCQEDWAEMEGNMLYSIFKMWSEPKWIFQMWTQLYIVMHDLI